VRKPSAVDNSEGEWDEPPLLALQPGRAMA
jgi:hypothetical protein